MIPKYLQKRSDQLARYGFTTSDGRGAFPAVPHFLVPSVKELDRKGLGVGSGGSPYAASAVHFDESTAMLGFMFSGDATEFLINAGNGGSFSLDSGALLDAATSPSD